MSSLQYTCSRPQQGLPNKATNVPLHYRFNSRSNHSTTKYSDVKCVRARSHEDVLGPTNRSNRAHLFHRGRVVAGQVGGHEGGEGDCVGATGAPGGQHGSKQRLRLAPLALRSHSHAHSFVRIHLHVCGGHNVTRGKCDVVCNVWSGMWDVPVQGVWSAYG